MATDGDERDGTAEELNGNEVIRKAAETRENASLWQRIVKSRNVLQRNCYGMKRNAMELH